MSDVLDQLRAKLDGVEWEVSHGQDVARVPIAGWYEFGEAAKQAGFEICSDITAVDWMRQKPLRFEVVMNLVSMQHKARLRAIASLEREDPAIASVTSIWPGAAYAEREVYDMFGIVFEGHPDLTRILMPDDWEGFPMRKDYGVGSVPVQFKQSHTVR